MMVRRKLQSCTERRRRCFARRQKACRLSCLLHKSAMPCATCPVLCPSFLSARAKCPVQKLEPMVGVGEGQKSQAEEATRHTYVEAARQSLSPSTMPCCHVCATGFCQKCPCSSFPSPYLVFYGGVQCVKMWHVTPHHRCIGKERAPGA